MYTPSPFRVCMQDALREGGAFPVVLSHCVTDFRNPLAREWALMCVRNACEGSEKNQAYVAGLVPQGVFVDEELRSKGIRVEIDPSRGKFTIGVEDGSSNGGKGEGDGACEKEKASGGGAGES
jgi:Spinocerebellar ataxia type 10 protein domain